MVKLNVNQKYYKVVSGGSYSIWIYQRDLYVHYQVGEWTQPKLKGSKLFVFDNLKDAKWFCNIQYGILYECEVKNPKKSGPFIERIDLFSITEIWYKYRHKKKYTHLADTGIIPGTVWVDEVKLTKRINPYD